MTTRWIWGWKESELGGKGDRNANGKSCPQGTRAEKPWISGSNSAAGFGNRIPKETGMGGGGVGLTIAEKL